MRMAKKKTAPVEQTPSTEVEKWNGHIAAYDRAMSKWESRTVKIIQRYTDYTTVGTRNTTAAKFNILWSNVQTLSAATFAKLPKPDVSRRFRDSDPIGRIGSLILERDLEYEIQHYSDYDFCLRACILDRFLGGRGTAWIRYEPHFRAMEMQLPPDGLQVTEDAEEPQEELDYECAPVDYVHWKDFGHTIARTWDEVTGVWRKVYMTRDAMVRRFGEELGNKIPLDAIPEEFKQKQNAGGNRDQYRALVHEIWDKETKKVYWLSKSLGEMLDVRDDPLGLEEFFPCPKPLYSTLTNESLEPTPDFTLYQDQARELDMLSDRIDGLVKALQVKGCYDASIPALGRLFTEGENTNLIPVKNWAAFAEKQGLKGAIDILDVTPIFNALEAAYRAMEQIKGQVYEITGISDIVRGASSGASKTATEQQIKGQFASLRLKSYQDEVARFAAEIIQLKAQVICNKFAPDSILTMAAAQQLNISDSDVIAAQPQLGIAPPQQPPVMGQVMRDQPQPPIATMPKEAKQQVVFGAALELLIGPRLQDPNADTPNPMRSFRVEIESDSLVHLDDAENKESRLQFLQVMGKFLSDSIALLANAGPMAPSLVTPLMEMWKFSAQAFKVGKNIEGAIDEATEQVKKALIQAASKPPPPDPKLQVAQIQAQAEGQRTQAEMQMLPMEMQTAQIKGQAEATKAQASVIEANIGLQEAQLRAANPTAFQAPARPQ